MLTAAVVAALCFALWPGAASHPARMPSRPPPDGTARPWVVRGLVRARRAVARGPQHAWVADFAEVVAVGLDAGLDLPAAALASAQSPGVQGGAPWLASHLRASVDAGRGVTTVLDGNHDLSREVRCDLALLVAAWRLAHDAGAAASAVTACAAGSVRERRAAADRTAVVVAGPRASMLLLSALPLAGPLAALLVGMPPGRLYDTTAARLLAVAGLLLTALGWGWARRLLRRAQRPGGTDGGPT